ncbi:extracellular solute-binding protein [Cohnella faecalis]|uniref:extracellular solute-binding protein n=1 Tax=Cohnella faecalis TaxID=2315694 RepID=UPI002D78151B|nr:extracellular solute-binding protein [Cohnella faecalis]
MRAKLLVWDTQGNELDYLKKVGADFEKRYGVPVKVAPVPNIDTVGKLVTDGPAGIGADVFSAPHDHVGKAVTAGLVLENDRTRDDIEKNDVPAALPALSYEEVLYGYPIAVDTYALYYNKKLLKEAPKTYEELIAFAKTYNDPKSKKFAFVWDVPQIYLAYSFLSGYGATSSARMEPTRTTSALTMKELWKARNSCKV